MLCLQLDPFAPCRPESVFMATIHMHARVCLEGSSGFLNKVKISQTEGVFCFSFTNKLHLTWRTNEAGGYDHHHGMMLSPSFLSEQ